MPLTDAEWRFVVEDLLGVRPAECEALVDGIAQRYPAADRARALARVFVPRALVAGAAAGLGDGLPRTLTLALLEQRAIMRQRATLLASLGRLDDPRFFERPDWPRRALGLSQESTAVSAATSEAVRFALRWMALRGARGATRWLGHRLASLAGVGAGAIFDGIEMIGFAEAALEERDALHERLPEVRQAARVVALLPVRRANGKRREDEETTEGS